VREKITNHEKARFYWDSEISQMQIKNTYELVPESGKKFFFLIQLNYFSLQPQKLK